MKFSRVSRLGLRVHGLAEVCECWPVGGHLVPEIIQTCRALNERESRWSLEKHVARRCVEPGRDLDKSRGGGAVLRRSCERRGRMCRTPASGRGRRAPGRETPLALRARAALRCRGGSNSCSPCGRGFSGSPAPVPFPWPRAHLRTPNKNRAPLLCNRVRVFGFGSHSTSPAAPL